ncbi:MAG: coenzyme-B sulfoethylthiotransferase subunit alpha [Methanosphaera sp.]|uniref:coenzyme-B sulfoethylthiotransferase subunit alpha n=1 Tax=Methanosphaera sp. ISO3-F5 TaxID=1452353 RepID=UPI00049ACBD4|nr:coenzyme-B sulfoethylthiotransferase subunit alpha [Methanosphaera sp. ISO3-F5]AHY86396.1 methyl coenzyme-M reductase [Methanosphaera sp. ISO3-F5]MBR0472788.1 coenzyme-B sulfoethylthiotransferase subunit alpha [Methanosphaera sp.]WQH65210.1 coenzyme-B sulfoethylthiotransferase subunit alpha [Methanosphaera sp. ISO3-F5]
MVDEKKLFLKALQEKFDEDPEEQNTKYYCYGGWEQSARKREFNEQAEKAMEARGGLPFYNPDIGVPLGQRKLMAYQVSGTDTYVEGDDLHFCNNSAIQQLVDDIKRTIIVGMDTAHGVLEQRLGVEVTPETINEYLETINHALPGGAVVQEHMVEVDPGLVVDSYAKVFSGDDELVDQLDSRFVIDINKEFPEEQAEQLKKYIGKKTYQVSRVPTLVVRACDGGTTSRWSAMQIGMSFISAYKLCAGEAAIADFSYAAKHADVISMASAMPARRARGPNEPGGVTFGAISDMVQTSRVSDDPAKISLEVIGAASPLYDQVWLGSYMSGGVGFTQYATAAYTDEILDDFVYYGKDYVEKNYGGLCQAEASTEVVRDIASEVTLYALEQYETPAALEDHFGGSQRACVAAAGAGCSVAFATANSNAGVNGWYLSQLLHKEGHSRLGFYGYDLQDQCGSSNSLSIRSDEGLIHELRGPNYPNYAMNVGHQPEYAGIAQAPHAARGDAFALNPLIKVAFADNNLTFDWANPRACIAKGAIREFMPSGERDLINPAL